MPKVHAQIRHVTDTDPVFLQFEDVIEPETDEDQDAGGRARKRRRIGTIANQYIKLGRVPLILSAELRGPFNEGWKNPWVTAPKKTTKGPVQSRGLKKAEAQKDRSADPIHGNRKQTRVNRAQPVSSFPSPEASRAPDITQHSVLPSTNLYDGNHASPGASTAQMDESGATEFFSVEPDPSITFDNMEGDPLWLRRPQLTSPRIGHHDPSPTRARLGHRPVDRHGRLLLGTPKQPVSMLQSDPGQNTDPEPDWISAASASMMIASPAKSTQIMPETMSSGVSARRKRTYSKFDRGSTTRDQNVARTAGETIPTDHLTGWGAPMGHYSRRPEGVEANRTPTRDTRTAHRLSGFTPNNRPSQTAETSVSRSQTLQASSTRAQQVSTLGPNTRDLAPDQDNQDSAGRRRVVTSSSHSAHTGQKQRKQATKEATPSLRHDHVTSPTFAASTGFVYRKVGEAKRVKSSGKSKPQPVTFSSPALIKQSPTGAANHNVVPNDKAIEQQPVSVRRRPDIYDVPGSPQGHEQQSYRSSRASGFSTQAALMMAQMEFQDSSMSTLAEDAPTPWLTSTAHEDPIIPSPAFTPFHKFNTALDEDHPHERTVRDVPISTQDLFATLSPFANSTVKKSTKSSTSNLRFSVFANRDEGSPSHGGHRNSASSPTGRQRKPLRDKNSRVSFLGSQSGMDSQGEKASQESIAPRPSKAPMVQGVELPPLDFHTSNGDLDFTDRFFDNVNEMS